MAAGASMGTQQGPHPPVKRIHTDRGETPLVGPRNEGEVEVNGKACKALIDSGSQITSITHNYWQSHPALLKQKLRSSTIPIEGAAGQSIPYRGVLHIDLKVLGKEFKAVPTFVVPDSDYRSSVPLLVGTNVIRASRIHLQAAYGSQFLHQVKEKHPEWYMALLKVGSAKQSEIHDVVGPAVYTGRTIHLPGGKEMDLRCRIKAGPQRKTYTALIEGHASLQLPQDVLVAKVLANVKRGCAPVRVMNLSQRVITIRRHTSLASAVLVDKVVEFPGKNHGEAGSRGAGLSLDQVVTSCGVDLSGAAVESEDQRALLRDMLDKNADVFSQHPMDYGHTTTVHHEIPLVDPRPFRLPYRKIPASQWQDVRRLLVEMETAGVIRPSKIPYASPVVVVTKKDGSLRLCIDYRKLNSCVTRDAFPLPRIEEALEALGQAKYFSTLDLTSGYWQVEVAEQDKHKTAFSTPMGLFEANRMPFGLQNAPSTFQRMMTSCFGDLNFTHLLIYLDDIIIFSKSFNEHLERLQLAFDRLREHGLKLKPSKCQLVRKEVQYLGHLVSAEGIRTDPEKINKVKDWERPTNRMEVLRFLGFSGYYRRYVKGYSNMAAPLYRLTSGDPKKKKRGAQKGTGPDQPFLWTAECEEAFQFLKEKLISAPVLGYPDYSQPFLLQTDASGMGLGAVLVQVQDGVERVIAYASRGLSPPETRYPAHKLEFLALKWAVTDKFHDHLYGRKFSVLTDNNPLKYVMTSSKLDATGQRWVSHLSTFDFDIQYRRGQDNSNADALSRMSNQEVAGTLQSCPQQLRTSGPRHDEVSGEDTAGTEEPESVQETSEVYVDVGMETLPAMTIQELRAGQKEDRDIGPILHFKSRNHKPSHSERRKVGATGDLLLKE
ncbi:retrovirus-related Pol polyprotein from transposon 297 [Triplophysa rosa]|uniref:retrovirus-related Pol polyprotein from transposon 297 n=1 Tax=Triplophysa rosa TaxID=992332 RepID=UPI0025462EBE|nr:retrovirus-related Pol polyprotein from transposon 297 [Triplophysa rosa]XP_057200296.1 retrovirus-related Pol polyprotein from transposon 297 [Triplophysa rosa]XP_057200297.1 retrovirus-related Pol polyprotein from transposon 297 [Triplophysa rosa]